MKNCEMRTRWQIRSIIISAVGVTVLAATQALASTIGYVSPANRPAQSWGSVTFAASQASSMTGGFPSNNTYDHVLASGELGYNGWLSGSYSANSQWAMWQLTASTTLSEASFWSYEQISAIGRDIQGSRLYVTNNSAGYTASDPNHASWGVPVLTSALPHNDYMFPMSYEVRQTFTPTVGQYVLLRADTNYGGNLVGLSEFGLNLPTPAPVTNGQYAVLRAKSSSNAVSTAFSAPATIDGATASVSGGLVNETTNGWFAWDLGASFDLTQFSAWNFAQSGATDRGVKDFQLYLTNDPLAFDPLADFGNGTLSGGQLALWGSPFLTSIMTHDDSLAPYQQDFSFTGSGRYALLLSLNNYGGSLTGLSEVQFQGELTVPEPACLSLLGAGLAGLGLRRRHRA